MSQYEQERLFALKQLNILDTPPSESFDRITRMASQLFGPANSRGFSYR